MVSEVVSVDLFLESEAVWLSATAYNIGGLAVPSCVLGQRITLVQFRLPADCFRDRVGPNLKLRCRGVEALIPLEQIDHLLVVEKFIPD